MALDGEHLRGLPLSMRKTNLAQLLARRPDGIFVAPFEHGARSGLTSSGPPVTWDWRDSSRGAATGHIRAAGRSIGSR
jgi:hypothetical protein